MFGLKKTEKKATLDKHKKVKIGLALGGGGARGFTHLGAIKAFEEYGLEFDYICGTSAGSIAGAFYAAGWKHEQMHKVTSVIKTKDIKTSKLPLLPSKTDGIEKLIIEYLGDINIEDLPKPFSAIAVDLKSTQECVITKGNLAKSVAASCCVPGYFQPVVFGDYLLCDGGLQNTLPASVPKLMGCDYVIAVDVNASRGYGTESTKMLDVIACSIRILMKGNVTKGYLFADVVVQPQTKNFKATKLSGIEEMIEEGYKATIEKMPEILAVFNSRPVKKRIKNKYKDEAIIV